MGPQTVARTLVVLGAIAVVLTGVAFGGLALYLWLLTDLSPPAAAAATAAIFLLVPALYVFVMALRNESPAKEMHSDNAALSALADVAKDKPLIAVLLAGIIGAAEVVSHHKK
ncbi:MAG: hypothetical protein ACT4OG_01540 [Alphaproteobacteria bacterium]